MNYQSNDDRWSTVPSRYDIWKSGFDYLLDQVADAEELNKPKELNGIELLQNEETSISSTCEKLVSRTGIRSNSETIHIDTPSSDELINFQELPDNGSIATENGTSSNQESAGSVASSVESNSSLYRRRRPTMHLQVSSEGSTCETHAGVDAISLQMVSTESNKEEKVLGASRWHILREMVNEFNQELNQKVYFENLARGCMQEEELASLFVDMINRTVENATRKFGTICVKSVIELFESLVEIERVKVDGYNYNFSVICPKIYDLFQDTFKTLEEDFGYHWLEKSWEDLQYLYWDGRDTGVMTIVSSLGPELEFYYHSVKNARVKKIYKMMRLLKDYESHMSCLLDKSICCTHDLELNAYHSQAWAEVSSGLDDVTELRIGVPHLDSQLAQVVHFVQSSLRKKNEDRVGNEVLFAKRAVRYAIAKYCDAMELKLKKPVKFDKLKELHADISNFVRESFFSVKGFLYTEPWKEKRETLVYLMEIEFAEFIRKNEANVKLQAAEEESAIEDCVTKFRKNFIKLLLNGDGDGKEFNPNDSCVLQEIAKDAIKKFAIKFPKWNPSLESKLKARINECIDSKSDYSSIPFSRISNLIEHNLPNEPSGPPTLPVLPDNCPASFTEDSMAVIADDDNPAAESWTFRQQSLISQTESVTPPCFDNCDISQALCDIERTEEIPEDNRVIFISSQEPENPPRSSSPIVTRVLLRTIQCDAGTFANIDSPAKSVPTSWKTPSREDLSSENNTAVVVSCQFKGISVSDMSDPANCSIESFSDISGISREILSMSRSTSTIVGRKRKHSTDSLTVTVLNLPNTKETMNEDSESNPHRLPLSNGVGIFFSEHQVHVSMQVGTTVHAFEMSTTVHLVQRPSRVPFIDESQISRLGQPINVYRVLTDPEFVLTQETFWNHGKYEKLWAEEILAIFFIKLRKKIQKDFKTDIGDEVIAISCHTFVSSGCKQRLKTALNLAWLRKSIIVQATTAIGVFCFNEKLLQSRDYSLMIYVQHKILDIAVVTITGAKLNVLALKGSDVDFLLYYLRRFVGNKTASSSELVGIISKIFKSVTTSARIVLNNIKFSRCVVDGSSFYEHLSSITQRKKFHTWLIRQIKAAIPSMRLKVTFTPDEILKGLVKISEHRRDHDSSGAECFREVYPYDLIVCRLSGTNDGKLRLVSHNSKTGDFEFSLRQSQLGKRVQEASRIMSFWSGGKKLEEMQICASETSREHDHGMGKDGKVQIFVSAEGIVSVQKDCNLDSRSEDEEEGEITADSECQVFGQYCMPWERFDRADERVRSIIQASPDMEASCSKKIKIGFGSDVSD